MNKEKEQNAQVASDISPFHTGEQILQKRVGQREKMETVGRKVIRNYMPEQHRAFYSLLPFMVVGGVDDHGWPWASLLCGEPGFVHSPSPTTLVIDAKTSKENPLHPVLNQSDAALGLLGIEMMTRRRNRINGRIKKSTPKGTSIIVDQSFGNCPQYIQNWDINFIRDPTDISDKVNEHSPTLKFTHLNDDLKTIVENADTFFVSSYVEDKGHPENGIHTRKHVDVSHRGGLSGFVKVENDILTVPDFRGNNMFNTLGNFLINPKAGLVFIDFSKGDMYMLTGTVNLLWDKDEKIEQFEGAERAWQFTLNHGIKLNDALPFRAEQKGYSPRSLQTGSWAHSPTIES